MKCFPNFEKPKPSAAGTVAHSHHLHKFGKLSIKFEMLCKITKSLLFQSFGGETSGCGQYDGSTGGVDGRLGRCGGRAGGECARGAGAVAAGAGGAR